MILSCTINKDNTKDKYKATNASDESINSNLSKELLDALKEGDKIIKEICEGKRKGYKNVNEMLKAILND